MSKHRRDEARGRRSGGEGSPGRAAPSGRRVGLVVLAFVLAAALAGSVADAVSAQSGTPDTPDRRDSLARQVRQKVEQLHAVRKKLRDLRERHLESVAREERRIESLRRSSSALETVVVEERRELAALEAEIARAESFRSRARDFVRSVSREALPVARAVAANVASRVADRDGSREASFRRLLADLEASIGSTTDEPDEASASGGSSGTSDESALIALAGTVRSFFEAIGDEWEAAGDVVLSNEVILLDDGARREHAWVLRLGFVNATFLSENGETVGLWSGDAESPWDLELDPSLAARLRRLFAIVREKEPPAVLTVPVRRAGEPTSSALPAERRVDGESPSNAEIEGARK